MRAALCGILAVSLAATVSAAPAKRLPAKTRAVATTLTPASYAAKVQGLSTCDQFNARLTSLPSAKAILLDIPVKVFMNRVEQKDEFETAAAFQLRRAAFWASNLGDATRIIIDVDLSRNGMDYGVEEGLLSIKRIVYTRPDGYTSSLQFSEKYRDRPSYVGQNAYGASVNVDSYSVTRGTLEFPIGQMLDDNGRGANMQWRLSMSPEDARAFKANPHMMVWASIKSPYLTEDVSLSKATIDDPTESSTHEKKWSADIMCASFTTGGRQFVKAITVIQ